MERSGGLGESRIGRVEDWESGGLGEWSLRNAESSARSPKSWCKQANYTHDVSARIDENWHNNRRWSIAAAHHWHRVPSWAKWFATHPQVVFHPRHSLVRPVQSSLLTQLSHSFLRNSSV